LITGWIVIPLLQQGCAIHDLIIDICYYGFEVGYWRLLLLLLRKKDVMILPLKIKFWRMQYRQLRAEVKSLLKHFFIQNIVTKLIINTEVFVN
jgi:hypothetical protein